MSGLNNLNAALQRMYTFETASALIAGGDAAQERLDAYAGWLDRIDGHLIALRDGEELSPAQQEELHPLIELMTGATEQYYASYDASAPPREQAAFGAAHVAYVDAQVKGQVAIAEAVGDHETADRLRQQLPVFIRLNNEVQGAIAMSTQGAPSAEAQGWIREHVTVMTKDEHAMLLQLGAVRTMLAGLDPRDVADVARPGPSPHQQQLQALGDILAALDRLFAFDRDSARIAGVELDQGRHATLTGWFAKIESQIAAVRAGADIGPEDQELLHPLVDWLIVDTERFYAAYDPAAPIRTQTAFAAAHIYFSDAQMKERRAAARAVGDEIEFDRLRRFVPMFLQLVDGAQRAVAIAAQGELTGEVQNWVRNQVDVMVQDREVDLQQLRTAKTMLAGHDPLKPTA